MFGCAQAFGSPTGATQVFGNAKAFYSQSGLSTGECIPNRGYTCVWIPNRSYTQVFEVPTEATRRCLESQMGDPGKLPIWLEGVLFDLL